MATIGTTFLLMFFGTTCASKLALLVIDVQNCFTEGGALEVHEGSHTIPVINKIRRDHGSDFHMVVFSQDWHCLDHVSFASQHNGYSSYDELSLKYSAEGALCRTANVTGDYTVECDSNGDLQEITQTLWPDHCVINTTGADFHPNISMEHSDVIVQKGYHCWVDSYSAFFDNGGFSHTELQDVLDNQDIDTVFIVGLATDFCVYYTALDAKNIGYKTYVVEDATRGIATDSTATSITDMKSKDIAVVQSSELPSILQDISSSAWCLHNEPVWAIILPLLAMAKVLWNSA